MLPFAFEDGMGFERYVDYALDVPMYFIKRGDTYHDVAGTVVPRLLAGNLAAVPGERATLSDWANHLDDFPRGAAEALSRNARRRWAAVAHVVALPALWVGLLYDDGVARRRLGPRQGLDGEERQKLRDDVPKLGFKAEIRGLTVGELAREMLTLARTGLRRRDRLDMNGCDETRYLDPIQAIVDDGRTAAEALIEKYLDIQAARLLGDRHDQHAGSQARPRGRDLLRDRGDGDRFRLLASGS
jgi:glutamate--cysteine ligase